MSSVRILATVAWLGLRTLPQRWGASASAGFGIALVVAVLVGVLSIAEGFDRVLATTGADDTILVMRGGTDTEMNSLLTLEDTRVISNLPGIRRGEAGVDASREVLVLLDLPRKGTGKPSNISIRGVEPAAFRVRPQVRVVAGRAFTPGRNEILAGVGVARSVEGVAIGRRLEFGGATWEIVGLFEAGGTVPESELWCDVRVLQPAYKRGNLFQSVYARLESARDLPRVLEFADGDPRLDVDIRSERAYYESQSRQLSSLIRGLGYAVAALMAIGAVFGAINTLYSAVAARAREIATLRALGFGAAPVVFGLLAEAMTIAAAGGLAGAGAARLALDGFRTSTLNFNSFSQVAFAFEVTPGLMLQGVVIALFIGLFGGALPAWRAARVPVAEALRRA